eukprot:1392707-Amorphochlora_amoeboformis.AAC.2
MKSQESTYITVIPLLPGVEQPISGKISYFHRKYRLYRKMGPGMVRWLRGPDMEGKVFYAGEAFNYFLEGDKIAGLPLSAHGAIRVLDA